MMQGGSQQLYLPEEEPSSQHVHYNGGCGMRSETSELQDCHRTIGLLEDRCLRLESLSQDLERRLEQEARKRVEMEGDLVIREREWEEKLRKADIEKQELQVQHRRVERQAKAFQKDYFKSLSELQNYHKTKHDLHAKVKKEIMEDLQRQERERELLNGGTNGPHTSTEIAAPVAPSVRRMASSSSMLPRAVAGRTVGNPRSIESSGIRDSCVNNSLADFFNLRP